MNKLALLLSLFSLNAMAVDLSYLMNTAPPQAYTSSGSPNYRYQGTSGQQYQYDLSRPADRMQYSQDLSAQQRDSLSRNTSVGYSNDINNNQLGGGLNGYIR